MNILILDNENKKLIARLTDVATTQPVFTSHYLDSSEDNIVEGSNDGVFDDDTDVIIVDKPAEGVRRIIKEITFYNLDSADHTFIIALNNDGVERILYRINLTAGSSFFATKLIGTESGVPGKEIQIRENSGWVQWRYEDEATWTDLYEYTAINFDGGSASSTYLITQTIDGGNA